MRNRILFVTVAVLAVVTPPLTAANLVVNGGFEFPVVGTTQGWDVFPSGTSGLGWTVDWFGGSNTYNGATRPEPANLELHRGVNSWAHDEGLQHAELDTDWDGPGAPLNGEPASVSIYQAVPTQNGLYTLSYAWSPRPGHTNNALEVYWDEVKVAEHSGTGGGGTSWTTTSHSLPASAGTTMLEFREVGNADSLGMFLDDVVVEVEELYCEDQSSQLCGGQTLDLGEVTVGNDDENLYVTFTISEPGWYLDETHVAVATSVADLPQTKNSSPIPGQFPYACDTLEPLATTCTATIPLGTWCDGQALFVAAHAAVIQVAGDGCSEEVFWATRVEGWDQGTLKTGLAILDGTRTDPNAALGAPDGTFYSLGFDLLADGTEDGWLSVGFDYPIYNGPGDDIVVQEVTFGRASYPVELAEVFGVRDSTAYIAGPVSNKDGGDGLGAVDLWAGIEVYDYAKLLDATNPALHATNGDGYDVDAIGACYLFLGGETAWGDGCFGEEFAEDRGWATYFTYTVGPCAACASE